MITDALCGGFEQQIALELYSASLYRQLVGWAHRSGLPRLEAHYATKIGEETGHADKLRAFCEKCGRIPGYPGIPPLPSPPSSLGDVLTLALAHEQRVSESIAMLASIAAAEGAHAAFSLLLWFAAEQVEEEDEARTLIALLAASATPAEFDAGLLG